MELKNLMCMCVEVMEVTPFASTWSITHPSGGTAPTFERKHCLPPSPKNGERICIILHLYIWKKISEEGKKSVIFESNIFGILWNDETGFHFILNDIYFSTFYFIIRVKSTFILVQCIKKSTFDSFFI